MIQAGLIGATGYTGEELLYLLLRHPEIEVTALSAMVDKPVSMAELFPRVSGLTSLTCSLMELGDVASCCDIVFLALPHTVSLTIAPFFLARGKKVVDLSADFRLRDTALYREYYGVNHTQESLLEKAVYGLPEFHRDEIRTATLVANPGCYPTSVILGAGPLVKGGLLGDGPLIASAITGITGAGRKAALPFHFSEASGDLRAYRLLNHQHTPEIVQELGRLGDAPVRLIFVPHIAPLDRGILTTLYVPVAPSVKERELIALYESCYKNEPFVRVLGGDRLPRVKEVCSTNICEIAVRLDAANHVAVVVAAIDNLIKGASGQALQNCNIMCGLNETTGLM
ncbi:MAG: N-acetyl-gamma-glutamyl-phosphate reductase [Candidatus Omnitrophica bacterium]|nr:N-acetyl-gamma-glutamyl-phosphate reductase [Candidatus Omnitrophota bacterium]